MPSPGREEGGPEGAGPSSSVLLTRLSASPASSTSSLTSSSSFDPHAEYHDHDHDDNGSSKTGRPHNQPRGHSQSQSQILGLRELAQMRKQERKASKEARDPETRPKGLSQVKLVSAVIGPGTDLPFASEVEIKGWRVVGGKSWTDLGRIGAYVVYDIEITLRGGGKISILRRYTDFVNLRSALNTRYPAFRQAIPPLPGKAHMSRFSDKFLSERQPRLQRFLRGVLLHPEMGRAGERSIAGKWVVDADARADG